MSVVHADVYRWPVPCFSGIFPRAWHAHTKSGELDWQKQLFSERIQKFITQLPHHGGVQGFEGLALILQVVKYVFTAGAGILFDLGFQLVDALEAIPEMVVEVVKGNTHDVFQVVLANSFSSTSFLLAASNDEPSPVSTASELECTNS